MWQERVNTPENLSVTPNVDLYKSRKRGRTERNDLTQDGIIRDNSRGPCDLGWKPEACLVRVKYTRQTRQTPK